jgi:hypothetical protein
MMLWLLKCCAWVRACCFRNLAFCARCLRSAWVRVQVLPQHCLLCTALERRFGARIVCCNRRLRSAWVRVLLVPQHCLLRATLAQRLGAGAAGPAALCAVRDACAALGCGCCWSRSIVCCARRLRSAWVRVLLVPLAARDACAVQVCGWVAAVVGCHRQQSQPKCFSVGCAVGEPMFAALE